MFFSSAIDDVHEDALDKLDSGKSFAVKDDKRDSDIRRLQREIDDLRLHLRSSEERFDSIINQTREGVLVINHDRLITLANPAAEFILGRPADELYGEPFGLSAPIGQSTEINTVAADGTVRFVVLQTYETVWDDRPAQLTTLKDITVEHAKTMSALEDLRRRDRFIAMLSHEIRNPLAAIRNATQLLMQTVDNDRRVVAASEVINRQFKHLSRMLDDLLEASRVSRGKLRIEPKTVNVLDVIREAVEVAFEATELELRTFSMFLPKEPIWISADEIRLQQVIVNLLANSVRYSDVDAPIELSLELEQDRLMIAINDGGIGIEASMLSQIFEPFTQVPQTLDRGVVGGLGLGLALAQNLVGMHGGRIVAASDGLGMGATFTVHLPGVLIEAPMEPPPVRAPARSSASKPRSLRSNTAEAELRPPFPLGSPPVDSSNGACSADQAGCEQEPHATIGTDSSADNSSTNDSSTNDSSADDQPVAGLDVLVIEDSADIRLMLQLLLESSGHRVTDCADGNSGWDAIQKADFDLAIVDIGLPGMSGYELAAEAAALDNRSSFRMVALTGYGRAEDRQKALAVGFDDHLVKPLQFTALQVVLDDCEQRLAAGRN